jgi:hypothetical protein
MERNPMKKKRLLLYFTVILTVLLTACNNKTETDPAGNDNSSYINDADSTDSDSQGEDNISSPDSSSEISETPLQGASEGENAQTDSQDTASGTTDASSLKDEGNTAVTSGLQAETSETEDASGLQEDSKSDAADGMTADSKTAAADEQNNDHKADAATEDPKAVDKTSENENGANTDITQKSDVDFMIINKENVPEYYINVDEAKPVEALNLDLSSKWIPVSQDNPVSVETTLSENSPQANIMSINNYEEEKFDVFRYTYDCVNGCWRFTEAAQRGFYFYSMHDMSDPENRSDWPRMRRCYYSDGSFQTEYLDTEDWFYAPYEDKEGNIYAECGRYISGGMSENPDIYISKMDQNGKTISKIRISELQTDGLTYLGFACIKKDIIAIIFNQTMENTKQGTQLQLIDLKNQKMTAILHLGDEISLKVKSDGDYFILTSASFQKVYVFDADTYELKNTVDTTKCKELCVYEWRVNDFESGRYSNLSYNVDIKDGKLYFLRHSGVYVTDCLKSEFYMLLDGSLFTDFMNQLYVYTSFFVGKDEDFYLLGVGVDEESATTMWHYTIKD